MKEIIFILGHGQNTTRNTGLKQICKKIPRSENVRKRIFKWDTNPERLAASVSGPVMLVGYSYGGFTAKLVADSLSKLGRKVDYMMLIDPVWRKYVYKASIESLSRHKQIILGKNIDVVYSWRQENGIIQGSPVIPFTGTEQYETILKHRHPYMDNVPIIHNTIIYIANQFIVA